MSSTKCSEVQRDALYDASDRGFQRWEPSDRAWALGRLADCVPRRAIREFERIVSTQDAKYHQHFLPLAARMEELGLLDDALRFARARPTPPPGRVPSASRSRSAIPFRSRSPAGALEEACADASWDDRAHALGGHRLGEPGAPGRLHRALPAGPARPRVEGRPELVRDLGWLSSWVNALGGSDAIRALIRTLHETTAAWT
jgi:hypothetical protein